MKKLILLSAAALTMAGCSGAVDNAKDHLDIETETEQTESAETSAEEVSESVEEKDIEEVETIEEEENADAHDESDAEEENRTRTDEEVIAETDWQIIAWEDLARYSEDHNGKLIQVEGEIQSLQDDGTNYLIQLMMYGEVDNPVMISIPTYATDTLLEGDYATFYGMATGNISYETVLGASRTAPSMWGMYMSW